MYIKCRYNFNWVGLSARDGHDQANSVQDKYGIYGNLSRTNMDFDLPAVGAHLLPTFGILQPLRNQLVTVSARRDEELLLNFVVLAQFPWPTEIHNDQSP
jgi:hypothetical protein